MTQHQALLIARLIDELPGVRFLVETLGGPMMVDEFDQIERNRVGKTTDAIGVCRFAATSVILADVRIADVRVIRPRGETPERFWDVMAELHPESREVCQNIKRREDNQAKERAKIRNN